MKTKHKKFKHEDSRSLFSASDPILALGTSPNIRALVRVDVFGAELGAVYTRRRTFYLLVLAQI